MFQEDASIYKDCPMAGGRVAGKCHRYHCEIPGSDSKGQYLGAIFNKSHYSEPWIKAPVGSLR
jgi:hypothetical protein